MRPWHLILMPALLAGCGQDDFADLRQFMDEAGKASPRKVEPLPPPQPMDPFVYETGKLQDPFSPGRRAGQTSAAGDAARPREALEDFPLDNLRVAGVIEKGGVSQALVATPDNRLYRVKKGDRIGLNNGVVTNVTAKGIEINERAMDSRGRWVDVKTTLERQKAQDAKTAGPGKP